MKESRLFTFEMDAVICKTYPDHGPSKVIQEISKRFGKEFKKSQIESRARVLQVYRNRKSINWAITSKPRPSFDRVKPSPVGFVGPSVWIFSHILVMSYVGVERRKGVATHIYSVRCLKCGREYQMSQAAIRQAKGKNTKGCQVCAPMRRSAEQQDRQRSKESRLNKKLKKWAMLHNLWPVTPINLLPEEKLTDGRGQPQRLAMVYCHKEP